MQTTPSSKHKGPKILKLQGTAHFLTTPSPRPFFLSFFLSSRFMDSEVELMAELRGFSVAATGEYQANRLLCFFRSTPKSSSQEPPSVARLHSQRRNSTHASSRPTCPQPSLACSCTKTLTFPARVRHSKCAFASTSGVAGVRPLSILLLICLATPAVTALQELTDTEVLEDSFEHAHVLVNALVRRCSVFAVDNQSTTDPQL